MLLGSSRSGRYRSAWRPLWDNLPANLNHPEARAGSLFQLGLLREEQGRAEEAEEFFREAHAADPSFPASGD